MFQSSNIGWQFITKEALSKKDCVFGFDHETKVITVLYYDKKDKMIRSKGDIYCAESDREEAIEALSDYTHHYSHYWEGATPVESLTHLFTIPERLRKSCIIVTRPKLEYKAPVHKPLSTFERESVNSWDTSTRTINLRSLSDGTITQDTPESELVSRAQLQMSESLLRNEYLSLRGELGESLRRRTNASDNVIDNYLSNVVQSQIDSEVNLNRSQIEFYDSAIEALNNLQGELLPSVLPPPEPETGQPPF